MRALSMPDHDDFKKSRAALLSTSVILFLFSRVNLQSDTMDIFGLKIGVSKDELVFFWQLVVLYFGYVFLIKAYAEVANFKGLNLEAKDDSIRQSLSDGPQENFPTDSEWLSVRRMKKTAESANNLLVNLMPPAALAVWSLAYSIWCR